MENVSGNKKLETQNIFMNALKDEIADTTRQMDTLLQNKKPSKNEIRQYEFKNISLKILQKMHDEYRESIYLNKKIDISPSKDIFKIFSEINTFLQK